MNTNTLVFSTPWYKIYMETKHKTQPEKFNMSVAINSLLPAKHYLNQLMAQAVVLLEKI